MTRRTKKIIKSIGYVALGGLGLSALSSANQSMGGTNYVGALGQGVGGLLPAYGSLAGAALVIDSAQELGRIGKQTIKKTRRRY